MARPAKGEPSKADAIRGVLAANPKMRTKDVVAELAGKGMKVSANHVYIIKSKGKQRRRKARQARVDAVAQVNMIRNPADAVLRVRRLGDEVGGLRALKQLVDAIVG
jgi:hypothetical protein